LLAAFLTHTPNHIAAALKLYLQIPVTDVFGVGATAEKKMTANRVINAVSKKQRAIVAALCMVAIVFTGCSKEERKMSSGSAFDYRQIALEFAKSLAAREYPKAYEMTDQEYRKRTSIEQLRTAFEAIVPTDWGPMGAIEVGQTMTSWPGKQPADLGWAYVSIGGNVYSEAVTVVVTSENGKAMIRQVEFGRP